MFWELLFVLHRAILNFVALPKTGRIPAEARFPEGPIETVAVPEEAPLKSITETPLPENSAKEQGQHPSQPRAEEPIRGRNLKRCKPRNQKADRTAKLEKALKLLDEGKNRRAIATAIGVAESTLRAWLKSERVACVPA